MKLRKIILSVVSAVAAAVLFCGCSGIRNDNPGGENASAGPTAAADTVSPGERIDLSSTDKATDGVLLINKEGNYTLTGSFDGYVKVDVDGDVELTLENAGINNENGPAILISSGDDVTVHLKEGTENALRSGEKCDLTGKDSTADGVIFSRADLVIEGKGSLNVTSEYKHGIVSKDSLVLESGTISVNSVKSGIVGKDSVTVKDGQITVTSGTDGIKSTNAEDEGRGIVTIEGGNVSVTSGDDGIYAASGMVMNGGNVNITAGNGDSDGAKGLNCDGPIALNGGNLTVEASDDAIHGASDVTIKGGTLGLLSNDDGIHADGNVTISDGAVTVSGSYEGIEGLNVAISGGEISLISSDDGINVTDGIDREAGPMGGGSACTIDISGGFLYVNAGGDGIDSNGSFIVSDGVVIVSGPENNGNGALDYQGSGTVTGGTVIAVGSSGMAMGFDSTAGQPTLVTNVSGGDAGSRVSVCDGDGNVICSFVAEKKFTNVVLTAPELVIGDKYTVYIGGECENEAGNAGFVRGGKLTGGNVAAEVTLTENMGQSGRFSHGGAAGPGGQGRNGMTPPDQDDKDNPPTSGDGEPHEMPGNGNPPTPPEGGNPPTPPEGGDPPTPPEGGDPPTPPEGDDPPTPPEGGESQYPGDKNT